jgi:diaminopimelate epimerase
MILKFKKYQGTGNDFIIVDNRKNIINKKDSNGIKFLCDRKFGIGADGFMLLEDHPELDFNMIYFNSDGNESTLCGNGARCIVAFANDLGITGNDIEFAAIDGTHKATIENNCIGIHMQDVTDSIIIDGNYIINTGSPHFVTFLTNVRNLNVYEQGKKIRYSDQFKEKGINVNFAEIQKNGLFLRTYERGVENETLSCGTGAVAASIATHLLSSNEGQGFYNISTPGGELQVSFNYNNGVFNNIWLNGPANYVFEGNIDINH